MSTIVFPDRAASARHARAEQCLARAAAAAAKAPVVGGARPWCWQLAGDTAVLSLVTRGRAAGTSRFAQDVVDCGSGLQHALTVLAGTGAEVALDLFPDATRPDLIASLRITGFGVATPAAVRAHRAVSLHTHPAALPGRATVPGPVWASLQRIATTIGARLSVPGTRTGDALVEPIDDTPAGWLNAGRALSAMALAPSMDRLILAPVRRAPSDTGAAFTIRLAVPADGTAPAAP
ncbi:hypothetical protein [Spirilliplanes yamanashiensis]|nr:hypothetical protein [Spirilliplanes yamanashiensis]MDP9818200.1 hypothetical protein [Spirilliplanes yamanashiensis]